LTVGAVEPLPLCGADVAALDGFEVLRGRRPLVLTNPTGVLVPSRTGAAGETIRLTVAAMVEAGIEVAAVAGPEHGFSGTAQAGFAEGDGSDLVTGVRVVDAYSADVAAWQDILARVEADCLVVDIADVGCRFYTYPVLMQRALTACALASIPVVVLDRPNPLGRRADGPVLERPFASGVGTAPVALQHGLTLGELAGFLDAEVLPEEAGRRLPALDVVRVTGWDPDIATPLSPWVPPSPNIPTRDTALVYPGAGLVEAVTASEGRGTTRPFETVGAPWMDHRFAEALAEANIAGVAVRECAFMPTFDAFTDTPCRGVMMHVTDAAVLRPVLLGFALLHAGFQLYPEFRWREDESRSAGADAGVYWIDKLTGTGWVRPMVDAGAPPAEYEARWQADLARYEERRAPHLLY
jgi:uncharacterized protein YbbC (DUF1343 family)